VFVDVLSLCKAEQKRRPSSSETKLFGGGVMNSGKFGIIKSFLEDVEVFWSEHAFAFFCRVKGACHL